MRTQFDQGGGSTGILTNKMAIARQFGVKQSEVIYFSPGVDLYGYKVIYDKTTQRAYSLPADITPGTTAFSLSVAAVLVHSKGSVDLGALAVTREEFVTLPGSFSSGSTINVKNELLAYSDGMYRWDGAFPVGGKVVPPGSTPTPQGPGGWVSVGDASLRSVFSGPDGKGLNNFFGGSGWTGSNASTENIYNTADDTNNNALRWRYDVPSTDNQLPIAYLKKTITTTRDPAAGGKPGRWDEGTIYSHVKKLGGSAYAAGITSMFDATDGTGDSVSIHARANGRRPHVVGGQEGSGVWGLWSFAVATPSDGTWIKQMLGLEIDCINNGQAIPFPVPTGQGAYIGAQITAVNGICSHGLEIGAGSGASWHRGIFIRQGAITPSNTFAGTSCIELEGGVFNKRVGGLNFGKGYFDYGINFAKPSEDYASLAAIIMGEGNRIYMGDSVSSANYIAKVAGQSVLNFQNLSIAINGTKVIGPRVTGIFALTGTADGSTKNTETMTLQELARYVKKGFDALIGHGLISPT